MTTDQLAGEILDQINVENRDSMVDKFDKLEGSCELASNSFDEGRKFLQSFVDEINAKYVGGVELFAGALISILPIPGAFWLGSLMMGDGVRRVVDEMIQLSDERRADP